MYPLAAIVNAAEIGHTAAKSIALFVVAVIGLRISRRRLLAELDGFDLAVYVAVGAIVGRTATSAGTSLSVGVTALVTLLVAHRVVAFLRRLGAFHGWLDRRPLILVRDGQLQPHVLRRAGLTESDVFRLLREKGSENFDEIRYLLFENTGRMTVVRTNDMTGRAVRQGLREAGVDEART